MWYQLKCAAVAMSGSELLALLRCIDSVAPISEMLISHATGAGLLAPGVPDGLTRIATVNYDGCATWLPSIVQFDWGDFFLARGESLEHLAGGSMHHMFACAKASSCTVRAVDAPFWEVLTTNGAIVARVQSVYRPMIDSSDRLESLVHLDG